MPHAIPTAKPGDVCILLEPGYDEVPALRQRQLALRARLGGVPHDPVHLTCQRFELPPSGSNPCARLGRPNTNSAEADLVQHLQATLADISPFPIVAAALVQFYSPFWQLDLLRWRVRLDDQLQHALARIDAMLIGLHITLHYPSDRTPLVTALEGNLISLPERALPDMVFPHPIFVARQVIVSRIIKPRDFEILGRFELQS